jgi:hypothetical protein
MEDSACGPKLAQLVIFRKQFKEPYFALRTDKFPVIKSTSHGWQVEKCGSTLLRLADLIDRMEHEGCPMAPEV